MRLDIREGWVDLDGLRGERAGVTFTLTSYEAGLLRFLAESVGSDVSRETLLQEVWNYAPHVRSRAVDKCVHRLRKKLEEDPAAPMHLLTCHGAGYRWVGPRRSVGMPEARATTRWTGCSARFFGRSAEIELGRANLGHPMVSVIGPAGVGKTRFVRQLLRQEGLRSRFVTQLPDSTDGLDVLVFEGEVSGTDLWKWARTQPEVAVWRTGYRRLGLPDERVIELEPLDDETSLALLAYLVELQSAGARTLSPELARELVERASGLPLALEMWARTAAATPDELLLERAPSDTRLDNALDAAIATLQPRLHRALQVLSCCEGPFGSATATLLLGARGTDDLAGLIDCGMVRWTPPDSHSIPRPVAAHAADMQVASQAAASIESDRVDASVRPALPILRVTPTPLDPALSERIRWPRGEGPGPWHREAVEAWRLDAGVLIQSQSSDKLAESALSGDARARGWAEVHGASALEGEPPDVDDPALEAVWWARLAAEAAGRGARGGNPARRALALCPGVPGQILGLVLWLATRGLPARDARSVWIEHRSSLPEAWRHVSVVEQARLELLLGAGDVARALLSQPLQIEGPAESLARALRLWVGLPSDPPDLDDRHGTGAIYFCARAIQEQDQDRARAFLSRARKARRASLLRDVGPDLALAAGT